MDILCDIDGTLANCDHRRHWVKSKPRNWPAFEAQMCNDTLIEPVAITIKALFAASHNILLCSARGEQSRVITEQWLSKHDIPYSSLYMRKEGDYRDDQIVKTELLAQIRSDGWNPIFVFDDRPKVIDAWRAAGLFVFNVGDGIPF